MKFTTQPAIDIKIWSSYHDFMFTNIVQCMHCSFHAAGISWLHNIFITFMLRSSLNQAELSLV